VSDVPVRCCDRFDPNDPEWGVGESDDLAVEVCAHVWHQAPITYSADDTDGGVFIRMVETPGCLTQHVCEDPNCPTAVLCSEHWATLV
jgi:hypothetical protein